MNEISLIANTGVQFYRFSARINANELRSNKFIYLEDIDLARGRYWLEELILIKELDQYSTLQEMERVGVLDFNKQSIKDADYSQLKTFSEDQPLVFEVGNVNQTLRALEKKWIPLPYFKNNSINVNDFGPTDWVRIYFEREDEENINFILAIDTTTSQEDQNVSPKLDDNPNENKYRITLDTLLSLAFFEDMHECEWMDIYLKKFFKFEEGDSQNKHIASFVFFMRILESTQKLPTIQLLSDNAGLIDVDMVIDVGSSRTCALLFENPSDLNFNLNKVKRLELVDFSDPFQLYNESFSTRAVFKDTKFGEIDGELNQNKKFQWISPVRVGQEAEDIINGSSVDLKLRVETKSYISSPKRYLWDYSPSQIEWNFHEEDENITVPRGVFKEGVSNQLRKDGLPCLDGMFGTKALFSRSSMMMFVYLEIFCQAMRQINSIEFRAAHGNPNSKRRIKHVLISCPTGMISKEQIALREHAEEALKIIYKYPFIINDLDFDEDENKTDIAIIPSIADLKKDLTKYDSKKDWNYDEATASQLIFLYGSIQHKFDGNPDLFFNLYGKKNEEERKKHLVIGSLDIGAGTSDLMICRYDYEYKVSTTIKPKPLYWESFNLAGDALLKNFIQQIVIEGNPENSELEGCTGVLLNHGKKIGIEDIRLKINTFFGKDNASIGYKQKLMRVNFINQIGIPIAVKYMEIANSDSATLGTSDYQGIFSKNKPSNELLQHFESEFGFKLEDVVWKLSAVKANLIIKETFDKLISQISKLLFIHSCDIVIISGRPCSFKSLEKMLRKNYPVAPNRILNLNDYWIGKWYPFSDSKGYIDDPKTVVSVGSLIGLMGGKLFKLDKFRIDTSLLINNLVSTANYVGSIEDNLIESSFMSPSDFEVSFMVYDLPYRLGFRAIESKNYPSRQIFVFKFSNEKIREQLATIIDGDENNSNKMLNAIEEKKTRLRSKLPFKVTISRDFEKDKESIKIEEIIDSQGDEVPKFNFDLQLMTVDDFSGYWLDSGVFTLNVN